MWLLCCHSNNKAIRKANNLYCDRKFKPERLSGSRTNLRPRIGATQDFLRSILNFRMLRGSEEVARLFVCHNRHFSEGFTILATEPGGVVLQLEAQFSLTDFKMDTTKLNHALVGLDEVSPTLVADVLNFSIPN